MLLLRDRFRERLWAMAAPAGRGHIRATGGQPCPAAPNPSLQPEPTALEKLLLLNSVLTPPCQSPTTWNFTNPKVQPWAGSWHRDSTAIPRQPSPASACPQAGFPHGKPSSRFPRRFCSLCLENRADPHCGQAQRGLGCSCSTTDGPRQRRWMLQPQPAEQNVLSESITHLKCWGQPQAKGKNEFLIFQFTLRKQMMH